MKHELQISGVRFESVDYIIFVTVEDVLPQKKAMSPVPLALQATALPTNVKDICTNAVSRGGYEHTLFCVLRFLLP